MELSTNLLEETKQAFANVRGSIVVAMQRLHRVKEEGVWEQVASTWGEYVEEQLGISQGFASKLLTVNAHYLLAGVSPEKLENIDYERLYLARNLSGSLDEQIAKAKTLNRSELRKEQQEDTPHAFEPLTICKKCHASQENHS